MSARDAVSPATSIAVVAGVLLLAGAVAAAYFGMRGLNETLRVERDSLRLSGEIEGLRSSLKDAEALRREYQARGEPALVARFDTLRKRIELHLSDLRGGFARTGPEAVLPALGDAIGERLATIERAMRERGTDGGAPDARASGATAGRVEQLLDEILARSRRLVAQREAEANEDLVFLERAMMSGILLAGLLLAWAGMSSARRERARQAAESALQARSRELRLLIDAVPAAIAYVDLSERVLLHNRAYARWLDLPGARIEGRTVRELIGEAAYAAAAPHIARVLKGETVHYERQQRRDDGSERDLAVTYVPHRNAAGAVQGYYALNTDVTGLKELSRLKSEFVSMVSHELRTPTTAIRGALGMLAGGAAGDLPSEAVELVNAAHAGCERLVRLVDDILDVERIEADEIDIQLRDEDLARLAQLALVAAGPLAAQRGVRLEMGAVPAGARAHTDAGRTNQVLTNLLANAIQFSPRGAAVQLAVDARGEAFHVAVRDSGPGVSESFRARLFEKFSQDPSAARGATGRFGLGLAISKLLVERLGGEIGYSPAPGGGSIFWFTLPRARGGAAPGRDAT